MYMSVYMYIYVYIIFVYLYILKYILCYHICEGRWSCKAFPMFSDYQKKDSTDKYHYQR